jgi:ABC-2 type transport system ATP-binding protein
MASKMISAKNLRKEYKVYINRSGFRGGVLDLVSRQARVVPAVNGVSFDVEQGEIVGYLGLNGSGKSTTLKMLTGVLSATSGDIRVIDLEPWKQRVELAKRIGVVFGHRSSLWWDLPVADSFGLLKQMYRVPKNVYQDSLDYLDQVVELKKYWDTPVRLLSLGERMRVEIAAAFLHRPKLLLLDEPTIGLDLFAKQSVRDFIRSVNEEYGVTVLITTHDLNDVEQLCRRVIVLEKGSVLFDGDWADLNKQDVEKRELWVTYSSDELVGDIPGTRLHRQTGCVAKYTMLEGNDSLQQAIQFLSSKTGIVDISIQTVGLEEILRRLYKESGE